jgi:hypothetical protein
VIRLHLERDDQITGRRSTPARLALSLSRTVTRSAGGTVIVTVRSVRTSPAP